MFRISGTGCCLLDYIYTDIDFSTEALKRFRSATPGDGGLEPGKLVFTSGFEAFTGMKCLDALSIITRGKKAQAVNIGGPAIVALINAAQLLDPARFSVRFTGALGHDTIADEIMGILNTTPVNASGMLRKQGITPFSYVLSDPGHGDGKGERTFLNNIGAAGFLLPSDLDEDFFDAGMVVFGGTAIVPEIHDGLDVLLSRAKARGAFTVVNTVYDFRNEARDPVRRWPLGKSDDAYGRIDLLICDQEEARRLSGKEDMDGALEFFTSRGTGAAVITRGATDVAVSAGSRRFSPPARTRFPISESIVRELDEHPERRGDTTGCGDNFAGGMIASVARQLEQGAERIDLADALAWGAVSGGFACFQFGGMFRESYRGEKLARLEPYTRTYLELLRQEQS